MGRKRFPERGGKEEIKEEWEKLSYPPAPGFSTPYIRRLINVVEFLLLLSEAFSPPPEGTKELFSVPNRDYLFFLFPG